MKLRLTQGLHAPAALMWPYITSPALMNTWSEARIELVHPGDGGGPDGVGTQRRVLIKAAGRSTALKEVIVASTPPHRLVYQVYDTEPITSHHGEIALVPTEDGAACDLTWEVEATYRWPAMEFVARRLLEGQLAASLKALAKISADLPDAPEEASPKSPKSGYQRPDPATMTTLWDDARQILAAQEALADTLADANDQKQWFARVYAFVTMLQLEACEGDQVTHVDWVLRLIPLFHTYYFENLQRWRGELPGLTEGHWADAFATMERKRGRHRNNPAAAIYVGLFKGIRAHIEEDLPRALAQLYTAHYADQCDYSRFRADYLRMGGIFAGASARLLPSLPDTPWIMRVGNDGVFGAWKQKRMDRFYHVARARAQAFERGMRLVRFSPDAMHFDPSA